MFLKIYNNLMLKGSQRKNLYVKGSGLHKHHIIPKHMGGLDDEDNFAYITIREHILAHYILWKIYKNPNDLRSMKMLGAKLTTQQRKTTGLFCKDNGLGIFSKNFTIEMRRKAARKGVKTQIQNKTGIHTDDQEKRKEWASLGGLAGSKTQIQNKTGIHTDDQEKRKEWASLGGKSHKGKKRLYHPTTNQIVLVSPDNIQSYLEQGFKMGTGRFKTSSCT